MFGFNSPAGLAGLGAGVPLGTYFTPVVAAGYGIPEGVHLSAGMEYRIAQAGRSHIGAFSYWTYTLGRHSNDLGRYDVERCSTGHMIKAGASLTLLTDRSDLVLRIGFAHYVDAPVVIEAYGGHFNPGTRYTLEDGPAFSVSVRFPLRRSPKDQ
jgi:hypothetical protein